MGFFYMNTLEIISKFEKNIEQIQKVIEKSDLPDFKKSEQFTDHLQHLYKNCQQLAVNIKKYDDYIQPFKELKTLLMSCSSGINNTMNAILKTTTLDFSRQSFQTEINSTTTCLDLIDSYVHSNDFISKNLNQVVTSKINAVNTQLENITKLKIQLEGIATEEVYNTAQSEYLDRCKKLEKYGYVTIFLSVFFTLMGFILHNSNPKLAIYLIILKATMIVIAIFLITYFFKQATHYRKLSDVSKARHLELVAIPSFLASMPQNMQNDIKKELALKYFGQPIDEKHYSSTENIIQEQIKSSTELVKIATSLVKIETSKNTDDTSQSDKPKSNTT